MENNKNEINVLDELNKGATMGMDAINFLIDKVEDNSLKEELKEEYKEYKKITDKISEIYPEYSKKEPHETSTMTKVMSFYGIEMKTMMDKSTSKIAELMLEGTNMGIIEGRKLLNHKDTNSEINKLVEEFVTLQEKNVENLKKFL